MAKDLKSLILEKIIKEQQIKASAIIKASGFSRTYVNRAFQALRDDGKILLLGKNKGAVYVLANQKSLINAKQNILEFHEIFQNRDLSEEMILKKIQDQAGIFMGLRKNVENIFTYAFLEMVNNAIEHSKSPIVQIRMIKTNTDLCFTVVDDGVGIFDNIKNKFHLPDKLSAIQQLLKGKQTTSPKNHTGQGIFFTSKMADAFSVAGNGKKLRFLNNQGINDFFLEDTGRSIGTKVVFTISLNSKKTSQAIFAEYTDKNTFEFSKTKVLVKMFDIGKNLLSRSEARRVLLGLEDFQEIILDFKDVETVGQGFADEIFRVWQNTHQEKQIIYQNANENVEFMIKRAI